MNSAAYKSEASTVPFFVEINDDTRSDAEKIKHVIARMIESQSEI
jgi:hypothetical protein